MATANQLHTHDQLAANAVVPYIRTLVVDDMPAMAETISSIVDMHPWVHVVGTAENGLAAVRMALVEIPDLVIMDVNMPVMDGLKAAMHIRQRLPQTRVIIVSSDDDPEIALAAMDCGADGFIPKANLVRKRDWHIRRLFGDEAYPLQTFGANTK